jgi:hypothetical protein
MPTDSEFALNMKFIHSQSSALVNMITKLSYIQQWTQSNQAVNRFNGQIASYYSRPLGCTNDERLKFCMSNGT